MTGQFSAAVVAQIMARDEGCCALCGEPVSGQRGRDWSVHHRRPRGMGGTSRTMTAADGILVHGDGVQGCHGRIESRRTAAHAAGFLVHQSHDCADVQIKHAVHGLCKLNADGTITRIGAPI